MPTKAEIKAEQEFPVSHSFIDRPIFATVLSVFLMLIGHRSRNPAIVPPTVQIITIYPGLAAETVSRTVGMRISNRDVRCKLLRREDWSPKS